MKLVTLFEALPLTLNKSASTRSVMIDAMRPYIFSDHSFSKIADKHLIPRASRISNYSTRLRPFVARQNRGETVLFYTGAGGYGDQIMAWPVAKLLATLGYKVHILADPGNELCWANFPWVEALHLMPIEQRHFELFQHHAIFEVATNNDEHLDQLHPVDDMLVRLGLDPQAIEDRHKTVKPVVTPAEYEKTRRLLNDRPVALYQLATTSVLRSLPPETSADLFAGLARAFPQFHWLGLHDRFNEKAYVDSATSACAALPNAELAQFAEFRLLFAAIGFCRLAVSADSFLVHLAGTCGIPAVGLWGSTDPGKRTRYYKNHTAVWLKDRCPLAPCWKSHAFPSFCPPSAEPRKVCAVVGAVTVDEVVAAAQHAMTI